MIPISKIRNDRERVEAGLKKKHFHDLQIIDQLLAEDDQRKETQRKLDDILAQSNTISAKIAQYMREGNNDEAEKSKALSTALKEETQLLKDQLKDIENNLLLTHVQLPNVPHDHVPEGKTPEENKTTKSVGEIPVLTENALPHWELAKKYDIIDFDLGVKLTGAGFPVYKGQGAKLQRALVQYFLDQSTKAGYTEVSPPLMVNEASAFATGQLPDKEGQMYVNQDGYFMIPTSEVPVTNIYRDVLVPEQNLPIKMTAFSPCFRREAGSYGKDVRGLNRLHQFDKVEIVQIVKPEQSYQILDTMVSHVENLLVELELPFRILALCGGDMSFASAMTYDFEVFSAAQQRWLEVSSVSNFEDFQANRLKVRYKNQEGKTELCHTLNGSALALPRIVAALLENHQTADGIRIPKALQPYTGFEFIK